MDIPSFNPDRIPQELKDLNQWVIWKNDKHPRKAYDGKHASVSDPDTWSSFDIACAAVAEHDCLGVGFVFTKDDPYVAIDLDKVIDEEGNMDPKAQEIIDKMDSYTEISKSGRGIHIIVKGKKPSSRCRKDHTEIYDSNRYFAITGYVYQDKEAVGDHQSGLEWLCEETFGPGSHLESEEKVEILPIELKADAEPPRDKMDLLMTNKSFKRLWEGKGNLKSLSDYDWKLSQLAYREGWEDQEVANLIIAFRRQRGDAEDLKKGLRIDYVARTLTKVKNNPAIAYNLTDTGNAEFLAKLYGEEVRYDHKKGRWLIWEGHIWEPDRDEKIKRLVVESARVRGVEANSITDNKKRLVVLQWAMNSENDSSASACMRMAKSIEPIADKGDNWDINTMLLGSKNGIIDLKTGKLRKGVLEDRITMSVGLDYNPEAKCPRWEKFLEEIFSDEDGVVDAEFIDWLWRVLGYSITGDTTEHIILMGYGEGANGKSRFFNAICNALGEYSHISPFSTFAKQSFSQGTNDVAALDKKRFVSSSETNEGTKMNIERIKALSGEDPISARMLYREFETFIPHLHLWMFVNHKPEIDDDTVSTWRRVRLIPFTKTFLKKDADSRLGEKLRAEAPGILAWLVRGSLEWQKRGLDPTPECVKVATGEYMRESDTIRSFLSECCEVDENGEARADNLYQAYKTWAKDVGRVLSQTAFGRRMNSLKYEKKRDGYGRFTYLGIRLNSRILHVDLS